MLAADLLVARGAFTLRAALSAPAGTVLAVVGENGSGKTTLLRALAGLERPSRGRIAVDGQVWCDTASGEWLAAAQRSVGWVPQDLALFPHLRVHEQIAFGPAARGTRGDALRESVARWLERLSLDALADRKPHELSGGQQQRVAIARALATEPRLLLLDEPLAAHDPQTRAASRRVLREVSALHSGVTLWVTHSPVEALAAAGQMAVLEAGALVQCASPDDVLRAPASPWIAEFLGLQRFTGQVLAREPDAPVRVAVDGGMLHAAEAPEGATNVSLLLHPHDVTLSLEPPQGSARNHLVGEILELVPEPPRGDRLRVRLATQPAITAEITRAAAAAMALTPGMRVHASFKATALRAIE